MPNTPLPAPANYQQSAVPAEISTPIEVSGADGMRAAEVRIQFDPSEVTTDASQIRSGSVWGGRAAVIANVNQEAGTIVAFVFSATPVETGDGALIDIDFTPNPNAQQDGAILIDVQKVRLNEGLITLTNEPVVGPDSSDGRIEISGGTYAEVQSKRIQGSFSADANEDNCTATPIESQFDQEYEDASWQEPQVQRTQAAGPLAETQTPLTPQAVDDVFGDIFDSHTAKKHDFNVRATWRN